MTLNDGNDWQDHQNLFEYGFNNYTNLKILEKGNITIYDDEYYDDYELYVKNDFYYLLSNSEKENLIFKYELEKLRKINNGDKIGKLNIYLGDKKIKEEDIFVKTISKDKKSFFTKIKEWFVNLW